MNFDQAYALLMGIGGESPEEKNTAYAVVTELLKEARDATPPPEGESSRWHIDPPGWDRNDPKEWADPPEATAGPAFNPSYTDLLNQVSTLRAERDALFTAARDVIQNIDRTGRAAAIAHLAEVIGETTQTSQEDA